MKNTSVLWCTVLIGFTIFNYSCKTETYDSNEKGPYPILSDHNAIDSVVDKFIDDQAYPFIHVRLEHLDGSVMYEHSAVNKTLVPDLEINKDTWIRIWSMSKIITISMVLDLVEDGILKLDDPVTKYIPEFKSLKVAATVDGKDLSSLRGEDIQLACPYVLAPMDSVMTILHLINHQAGFYYAVTGLACLDSLAAAKNLPKSKNSKEFIDKLCTIPLIQQPGSSDHYGTNTTVLGFVAERATGKSLKELIRDRVTTPLKIEGLQYGLADQNELPPRVSGVDSVLRVANPGELDIFGPSFPNYSPASELYLGGEGMVGTADGYADFIRMLVNHGELNGHRFLDHETVQDIYAPHTYLNHPYGYNGYNLWVAGDSSRIKGNGDKGIWIGGGYEGTHFWADPKRKFVGVIMSQMFGVQPLGYGRDDKIRGAIYRQLWAADAEQ